MKQNQCESYIPNHSIKFPKKKKKITKLNKRERQRVKDAAVLSLSVETWALDNECQTYWASEIKQCMDAKMVSFLDPTVKGVRDARTDSLIVIWFDF